ncbi:hypothetical protein GWI33_021241 [Rhynchophorus ferrugineus]|uniref:Uncharacterized protein n=1 Tax=Rhynchophorus ferrugineus TaxID=354439 RepID=A0A834M3F3_RHYFE|nr:hypothetical protein GWI33_021241 [Rhynchophorus ferrugineus]
MVLLAKVRLCLKSMKFSYVGEDLKQCPFHQGTGLRVRRDRCSGIEREAACFIAAMNLVRFKEGPPGTMVCGVNENWRSRGYEDQVLDAMPGKGKGFVRLGSDQCKKGYPKKARVMSTSIKKM